MIKKLSRRLGAAFTFSMLSSLSVLLIVVSVIFEDFEPILTIIASSIFWLFLLFEQLYMWLANATRRKIEKVPNVKKLKALPGVISFFRTPFGFVMDIFLIAGIIAYAVLSIGGWGNDIIQFSLLFLIVFSFRWHSIANGKNYRYKKLLKQRRKKNEVND